MTQTPNEISMFYPMLYLLRTRADDGREQFQIFKDLTAAENRYFRLFTALTRSESLKCDDGGYARITGCWLHEVHTDDLAAAKDQVRNNKARPVHSSADSMCGPPITVEGLFRTVH